MEGQGVKDLAASSVSVTLYGARFLKALPASSIKLSHKLFILIGKLDIVGSVICMRLGP